MKTKAKKFSHKLLALFMALVMAITCFSGAISAFGYKSSETQYSDNAIDYNSIGWAVLTDEQVATAALDYADELLASLGNLESTLAATLNNTKISVLNFDFDTSAHTLKVYAKVVFNIKLMTVTVDITSVNGLINTINSVNSQLGGTLAGVAGSAVDLGDILQLSLGGMSGMSRQNTSSTDICRGVVGLIYQNVDLINKFLQGTFTLGSTIGLDVYGAIGGIDALSMDKGYESNLIYNIVQQLIFKYTKWYTEDEIIAFKGGRAAIVENGEVVAPAIAAKTFVFDDELLDKLTTDFLAKISVLVTYGQEYDVLNEGVPVVNEKGDGRETKQNTSYTRYKEIKAVMDANGWDYATAADSLGYDPNLVYSDEFKDKEGNFMNVCLFAYGSPDENGLATEDTETISLTMEDSLFKFGYEALRMAWKTVIDGTVNLVHANYDVERGHGSNFDNAFFYYMESSKKWNYANPTANYTMANVTDWANHEVFVPAKDANGNDVIEDGAFSGQMKPLYETYGATDAAEFIQWVREDLEYDRGVKEGSTGKWSDIDATTITNKVRYSPLADLVFDMQTGPINLYFMQLGTENIDRFFNYQYKNYKSLVAGLNDALIAAVKDIFVQSENVHGSLPQLTPVGSDFTSIGASQINSIANTLVGNALQVVQYTADAIDLNILKAFYDNGGTVLTEGNLEEAMIPLLVACVGQISIDGKLCRLIHPEDWDKCKSAEAVAFLALREYLSYVLPDYNYNTLATITDTEIVATLDGTLLPMARDAVAYVMEGYVPVCNGSGVGYKVENKKPGQTGYYVNGYTDNGDGTYTYNKNNANDLFTLLNSVICYYADFQNGTKADGKANGVAALLGICTQTGNTTVACDVNTNNDLFTNINNIANHLLPVIGTLQGKGYKNVDSYDLIWNKIVKGIVDIGPNDGVTNFLKQLLTIVSAEPIQTTPIVLTVYDVAADFLNALFGGRYTSKEGDKGQYANPVPARSSNHPFDDILQKNTIAGSSDSAPGVLGKALVNFAQFAGVGGTWTGAENSINVNTYPDSLIPAITFAVVAVNSFTNIFPVYGEHTLKLASADFKNGLVKQGIANNATYSDKIVVKNNSTGVNTVTLDGMNNDAVNQNSRYFIQLKSAKASSTNGATITVNNGTGTVNLTSIAPIAPDKKAEIDTKITSKTGGGVYTVDITYDIVDKNNNVIHADLVTTAYKYVTPEQDWIDALYPAVHGETTAEKERYKDGKYMFPTDGEGLRDNGTKTKDYGRYRLQVTLTSVDSSAVGTYPREMVLNKSNLGQINTLGILLGNYALTGKPSVDGFYFYDDATVYDDRTGQNVTVDNKNAIPVFDKTNGDILLMDKYDYWDEDLGDWNRCWIQSDGVNWGWRADEVPAGAQTRPHVAYTLEEAKAAKILKAYHVNPETGYFEYMYMQTAAGGLNYDTTLSKVSLRGPIDGIYVNMGDKIKMSAGGFTGSHTYIIPFNYDGVTDIQPGNYDNGGNGFKLRFYNSNSDGKGLGKIERFVVADDSSKETLLNTVNRLMDILDSYDAKDFGDYNAQTHTSATYNRIQNQIKEGIKVYGTYIGHDNSEQMADYRYLGVTTKQTTNQLGDKAYMPYEVGDDEHVMPANIQADAYDDGDYYYFDEACKMPIYTNIPLDDDVVDEIDGAFVDPTGAKVAKDADGVWRLVNEKAYDQKWIFAGDQNPGLTMPALVTDKTAPLTNDNDEQLYEQQQNVYRNSYGNKCNSTDNWVVRIPATEYKLYEYNSTKTYGTGSNARKDPRGIFTAMSDNLKYFEEEIYENLNDGLANSLFSDITLFRTGLNNNNFDVVTFNSMKKAANAAENNFTVKVTYTPKGKTEPVTYELKPTDAAGHISWLESEGIDDYTWTTASTLSSLQIANYTREFDLYLRKIVERGYLGDKVEQEINCATGTNYNNLEVTQATWVEVEKTNGTDTWTEMVIDTPATVKLKSGNAPTISHVAPATYDADGYLVNADANGNQVYTTDSWNYFTAEIAEAVALAQRGHASDYAGKTRALYNVDAVKAAMVANEAIENEEDKINVYDAAVTACYTEFKDLRRTEIGLEEFTAEASDGYTVSADIVIAKNTKGDTDGVGVTGQYTVQLVDADNKVVRETTFDSTYDNCTFTITGVPNGTYNVVITSDFALTRDDVTVVVNGADVTGGQIPIIACNFNNNDQYITAPDAIQVYNKIGADDMRYNLNGDAYITAPDAIFVYSCIGELEFTPIELK